MRSALLLLLLPLVASAAKAQCVADPDHTVVELQTSEGTICIELLPEAPETVANFLGYVNRGDYDGTFFHRSVPGFVIQGGGFAFEDGEYRGLCTGGCPNVKNEFKEVSEGLGCGPALETPGCNVRATVAMARPGGTPQQPNLDSATSQWFINLSDDNDFLDDVYPGVPDDGFTIFGRVVDMAVADAIAALPLVDGEFVLRTPLRSVMSELPVTNALPASCFDLTDMSVVLSFAAFCRDPNSLFASDPLLGPPAPPFFYFVSPSCFGMPAGCSGDMRTLPTCRTHRRADDGALVFSDDFGTPTTPASCEAREASNVAQAALAEQIPRRLVQLSRAFVVPEPGPTLSRLAALAAMALLARRWRS